jgi:hypothetical protein
MYVNFIIYDLEWNNVSYIKSVKFNNKDCPNEIIEIGAIKVNENLEIIDKFYYIIKPKIYRNILVKRLTKMSGITKDDLKKGNNFDFVINKFLSWLGNEEYLLCTWGTDDMSEIIEQASQPVIDLCGKTDLPTLLGVLGRAELLIGVDSGVLHMAAAVGTKVVGLYGMSDPKATGPQGEGHEVIRADLDCSPCQLSECKLEKKCMTDISSDQVIAAGDSVLSRKVAAH